MRLKHLPPFLPGSKQLNPFPEHLPRFRIKPVEMSTPAPATSIRLSAQLKSLLSSSIGHAPSPSQAQLESLFDSIRLQSEEQYVHINSSSTEGGERPENGQKGVGKRKTAEIWLIVITGALFALNALEAIPHLYAYAVGCYTSALDTCTLRDGGGKVGETEDEGKAAALWVASRMREVGLKSTSFMGVPRVRLFPVSSFASVFSSWWPTVDQSLREQGGSYELGLVKRCQRYTIES